MEALKENFKSYLVTVISLSYYTSVWLKNNEVCKFLLNALFAQIYND